MPQVMKRLSAGRKTIRRDIDDLTDAGLVGLKYARNFIDGIARFVYNFMEKR